MLKTNQYINLHKAHRPRRSSLFMVLILYLLTSSVLITKGENMNPLNNTSITHLDYPVRLDESISTTTVNASDTMSIEFLNVRPHGCGIAINGAATASVTGGVAPYTYEWSTSPIQLGPRAIRLSPGTYTITATDNTGSQIIDSIEIIGSPLPIQLDCPGSGLLESCLSQNEIDTYLENWLTPFRNTELLYFDFTYDIDINGNITTGVEDLNSIQLDSTITGYMSVTMNVTCGDSSSSCMATLFITEPSPIVCAVSNTIFTGDCNNLDADFTTWINDFSYGGGCQAQAEFKVTRSNGSITFYNDRDSIPRPIFCGEFIDVEMIVTDINNEVSCSSRFTSVESLPSTNGIGLIGPTSVCVGHDGYEFVWETNENVNWSFSGVGAELIEVLPKGIQLGFRQDASEGNLTVQSESSSAQEILFIEVGPEAYCNTPCPEGFEITPFILEEGGSNATFSAQNELSISGATSGSQEVGLASGSSIEFKPGFSIAQSGKIEAQIENCMEE